MRLKPVTYLGKPASYWETKESSRAAAMICGQPETWSRTQKQVREQKDAIKAFMEPALAAPDRTVVFNGVSGIMAQTVFAWMNAEVRYNVRYLAADEVLSSEPNYVMISIESADNTMELAADIDRQPETVRQLIVTANPESALVKAAQGLSHMYGMVLRQATLSGLLLGAFMTLHLDILDDLQVDDMIHTCNKLLNEDCKVLEKFVDEHAFSSLRGVGFNVRQKRHGIKEMSGVIKVSFVSPYTGIPYEGDMLNLVYIPDDPGMRQEQQALIRALRKDGQLVYAVEARHEGDFNCDGILDMKLLMARNNVYAAFAFLMVLEVMSVFKAVYHNISLDEPGNTIRIGLDSWQEKQTFEDTVDA